MSWISVLRDGENLGEAVLQREMAYTLSDCPVVPGVGTGYSAGVIGKMNGSAGANPNHFSVQANGANLVLTIQPGYAWIVKDSGASTYDPRVVYLVSNAPISLTLVNNTQGSARLDTICIRFDQSIAPDSVGSNLPTIVQIQGGASQSLSNAPADGALYLPLANVLLANNAVSVAQGNVTDKRMVQPSQARALVHQVAAQAALVASTFTNITYDTIVSDPAGQYLNPSYGIFLPGIWRVSCYFETGAVADGVTTIATVSLSGVSDQKRVARNSTGAAVAAAASGVAEIKCAYGDFLRVQAWCTATPTLATGAALNWASLEWIGF